MDTCISESPGTLLDEAAIQQWLVTRLAILIGGPADDIDPRVPFSYYGLDSVAALGLSGELETLLGRKLSPTLLWDYPSVELLSAFLTQA